LTLVAILSLGVFTVSTAIAEQGSGQQNSNQQQSQTSPSTTSDSGDRDQDQDRDQTQDQDRDQDQVMDQDRDGDGAGEQEMEQEREQEREQEMEQEREHSGNGTTTAQQVRSQVANAVQEMLRVADRNGGIGEQVREVAQNQNQNHEDLGEHLENIQNRSRFTRFLIGPNYGEIQQARELIEQNQEQIQNLIELRNRLSNQADQNALQQQIQVLQQANLQLGNMLDEAESGFSLFGFIFRIFAG